MAVSADSEAKGTLVEIFPSLMVIDSKLKQQIIVSISTSAGCNSVTIPHILRFYS